MSNTRLRTGLLGVGVVLLMAAPIAYSQNLPKGPSPVVEDGSRLSGAEQITKSKKRKAAMDDYLKQMVVLQEQAKKDKDLVRIDCVNSKISETRDLLDLIVPALSTLEQAVKDDDNSKRLREYTKISLSHDRTEQLLNEAKTCAGKIVSYTGDTITEVEIDGEIPDPTEPGLGELPVDRPADFSPLQ